MPDYNPLLSLPVVLGANILTDWLPVKCTACLDAAVCNRKLRGFFLQLLRVPGFYFIIPDQLVFKDDLFYEYVDCRGMMLLSLRIWRDFRLDLIERVLQYSGSSVATVTLWDVQSDAPKYLRLVEKYCSSVVGITLHACNLEFSFLNILRKNKLIGLRLFHPKLLLSPPSVHLTNLRLLWMDGLEFTDSLFTAFLCITSKNLAYLHVSDCSVSPETLAIIGDLCPHLQTLYIKDTVRMSNALVTVSEKCTQILDLHVSDVSFRVGDLQRILTNLLHLEALQLTRNTSLTNSDLAVLGRRHGASLLDLSLQECAGFNAAGLCEVLRMCLTLLKLVLRTTPEQITPQVIECIQHTALRSLYIFSYTTDEVKHAIGSYGKRLTHIGLLCSRYDTSELYNNIVRNCTQLKVFYVLALPADVCDSIRTAYPWIDVQRDTFPPELSYLAGRD